MKESHRRAVARLANGGMTALVQASPVRFGYYRADHVLEANGSPLYEHPQRVGSGGPYTPRLAPLPPPDPGSVAAAANAMPFGARVVLRNEVDYAGHLEWGTSRMAARAVYQRASDAVAALAEAEAGAFEAEFAR